MTSALLLSAYDPNDVKPGWVAFFLVLALGVATYLLWRSMNTQLGKIKAPTRAQVREASRADGPIEPSLPGDVPKDDPQGPVPPR